MAKVSGTLQTYQARGNRESLADMIYDISPMDFPFMSNISRGKAQATFEEWQTDVLASATADNITIEGDEATYNTVVATVRLGNRTQISDKAIIVSRTQDIVSKAGRKREYSRELAKRGKELKRDIERRLCSDQASAIGTAAGGRECAGLGSWLWNNQIKVGPGTTGTTITITSGAPTTDPVNGTATAFTEANLKNCISACWDDGGSPNMVLVGSFNKQRASNFAGIATQYRDNPKASQATIIGAADVYVSDFGTLNIVPTRFSENDICYVIDTEYWEVRYLDPIQSKPLAETGHASKGLIWAEYTLCAKNPASSGKVYNLTTS